MNIKNIYWYKGRKISAYIFKDFGLSAIRNLQFKMMRTFILWEKVALYISSFFKEVWYCFCLFDTKI